jgi:O-antigen/teichoic acid export membrane protein
MRKHFIINIIIIVAVNLAIKPIWIFGIDRNVQLTLGDAQYGLYAALVNLSIVFNILLDMGLTNLNSKLVSQNTNVLPENIVNIAVVKLILFLVYIIVLFLCAFLFHYNQDSLFILLLLAIIQFLNSFLTFLRSNISANQLFKTDSFLSIADKLIMVVVIGFIFLTPSLFKNFNLHQFLYIQIFSYFLAICIAILFTKKIVSTTLQFSWQKFLPIIKQTVPYAILILLMGIYLRSDMFLLERWLPDGSFQSGMYAKSYRLLDALNMIGFLFAGILLPMFAKQLIEKVSIFPLLKISTKLLLPASIAISIFCIFYAQSILAFFYHTADASFVLSFQLVISIFPALCIMNIYSTLLASAGKINKMIIITAIGSCFSIVANYFSILYFKNYIGVSVVALLVQYGMGLGYILGSKQTFGNQILKMFDAQLWITSFSFLIFNIFLHQLHCTLLVAFIANALLYLPFLYWHGFFNRLIISQFFNKK